MSLHDEREVWVSGPQWALLPLLALLTLLTVVGAWTTLNWIF